MNQGKNRSLVVAGAARSLAGLLLAGASISRHLRRNFTHVFSRAMRNDMADEVPRGRRRDNGGHVFSFDLLNWFGLSVPERPNPKRPRPWWTYRAARRNAARRLQWGAA
jgi:hypothetical protein